MYSCGFCLSETEYLFRIVYKSKLRVWAFMVSESLNFKQFKSVVLRNPNHIILQLVLAEIFDVDTEHAVLCQIYVNVPDCRNYV